MQALPVLGPLLSRTPVCQRHPAGLRSPGLQGTPCVPRCRPCLGCSWVLGLGLSAQLRVVLAPGHPCWLQPAGQAQPLAACSPFCWRLAMAGEALDLDGPGPGQKGEAGGCFGSLCSRTGASAKEERGSPVTRPRLWGGPARRSRRGLHEAGGRGGLRCGAELPGRDRRQEEGVRTLSSAHGGRWPPSVCRPLPAGASGPVFRSLI